MNDNPLKGRIRRRRSLLVGLALILLISCGQCLTDSLDYRRLSIMLDGVRRSPDFHPRKFSKGQTISDIEENQRRIRLDFATHVGLGCIALWCLYDSIRMGANEA
jgi:hypothetical protein